MKKSFASLIAFSILCLLMWSGCSRVDPGNSPSGDVSKPLRIGYVSGPMAAPLYAAAAKEKQKPAKTFKLIPFKTTGDVGYGLLSGDLDGGLIEPDKAMSLFKEAKNKGLKAAGVIEFPYGASLVLRKDLKLRLDDLTGRTIAAEEPDCVLVKQFKNDAKRLGLNPDRMKFVFMPFEEMVPALEAGKIDGSVTKSSHALIAESLGHKILYQNWKISPGGDTCCPAFLAQVDYFLVVRPIGDVAIQGLVDIFTAANNEIPANVKELVSKETGVSLSILDQFPLPSFSPLTKDLRLYLKESAWGN